MVCPHCRKEIKKGKFCQYCGGGIAKQYSGKVIMSGVIGISIAIFILVSAITNHVKMISDEQFQQLMQNVSTTRIGGIESYFYVDEIAILSKEKDKESKQIKVTCDVTMTDDIVSADVKYIAFCNELDGRWHITRTTIDTIYDIRPLQGVVEPTDIIEDSIQGFYPQINWGYKESNILSNDIDYDFPIYWSLKEKNTDLDNKKNKFVYDYSFTTYTAQVTGVVEFDYEFSSNGMWELVAVEQKQSDIDWNLEGVWSFNVYTYYIDVAIWSMDFDSQIADVDRRGSILQGAGTMENTKLGFVDGTDCIYFNTLTIPSKNSSESECEVTLVAQLDDLYHDGVGIGGKNKVTFSANLSDYNVEDEIVEKEKNNFITKIVSKGKQGVKANIVLCVVDNTEDNPASLYKGSRIRECAILSRDFDTCETRAVHIYPNALFPIEFNETEVVQYGGIRHAYSNGIEQVIPSLNLTLDLDITNYIVIGGVELKEIVDYFGGISYEITDYELEYINKKCESQLDRTGKVILNGEQVVALFFSIKSSSYYKTEIEEVNLRIGILNEIFQMVSALDEVTYRNAEEFLSKKIYTSLQGVEAIALLKEFCYIEEHLDFPFYEQSETRTLGLLGTCTYSENMVSEVSMLHSFMFGRENYVPSEDVQIISTEIEELVDEHIEEWKELYQIEGT